MQQHCTSCMIYLNMYMKIMMHIPPFMVHAEPWSLSDDDLES